MQTDAPSQVPEELQSLTKEGILDPALSPKLEQLYSSQQKDAVALNDRDSQVVWEAEEKARNELSSAQADLKKAGDALEPNLRSEASASTLMEERFSLPDPKSLESDIAKGEKDVGKLKTDLGAARDALKGPADTVAAFEKKFPAGTTKLRAELEAKQKALDDAHRYKEAQAYEPQLAALGPKPNAYELTNGVPRVRNLNPGVNASGYPHEGQNGPGASFRIQIQAAN